ncbi:MAG: hypothetical protein IH968_10535 [Gemmatimonadetes bacterium]|nr:hypothetical protein [Gemmatimonadota bacterium]
MLNFFFYGHSGFRYLILLVGIATVLYALFGAIAKRPYDKPMRALSSGLAGALHLQILLGLALIFSGRFYPAITIHFMIMLLAAASAQIPVSVMRRRPAEERSYLPHAIWAVVALGLVAAGVMAIGRPIVGSG